MCVCSAHLGAAFEKLFDGGAGAEGRAEGGAEGVLKVLLLPKNVANAARQQQKGG